MLSKTQSVGQKIKYKQNTRCPVTFEFWVNNGYFLVQVCPSYFKGHAYIKI